MIHFKRNKSRYCINFPNLRIRAAGAPSLPESCAIFCGMGFYVSLNGRLLSISFAARGVVAVSICRAPCAFALSCALYVSLSVRSLLH